MINKPLSFALPIPWKNQTFTSPGVGAINFLVGPNGTGKSKFGEALRQALGTNARLLGTDRLSGMEQQSGLRAVFGDHMGAGYRKDQFPQYKNSATQGAALDVFVTLEERMDLRIQVEATVSQLFGRRIVLEWDSGMLVPRAVRGVGGTAYRLDRDECHGIKELIVLLTVLYNQEHKFVIIDEPELNLHPQLQSFLMQEVRKVAGDPAVDETKKTVFLITHSPFILDFRTIEDVKAVISFSLDYAVPRELQTLDSGLTARLAPLVPRLNVHHKQLFFSDSPIFVEGILDAHIVGAIQEARGVSTAAAGSCIVDAGGCEEVTKYFELCKALGKSAYFIYDLDSLFGGGLRACVKSDGSIQHFLASAGVEPDFGKYCGDLEAKLTNFVDRLASPEVCKGRLADVAQAIMRLADRKSWDRQKWMRARVIILTAISRQRADIEAVTSAAEVVEVEGRLRRITEALQKKNINLLPGGTLERYLPAYDGDFYVLTDDGKRRAVAAEIVELSKAQSEAALRARYGDLYEAVCRLPSKQAVDLDKAIIEYLSAYIHAVQLAIVTHEGWDVAQLRSHLETVQKGASKVFVVDSLERKHDKQFVVVIRIVKMLGQGARIVHVTEKTNAGIADFAIQAA